MARAQKSSELRSIDNLLGFVMQLAQVDPEATQWLNTGNLMKTYQEGTGSPVDSLKSDEEMEALFAQQAAQAAQEQAMAMAQVGGSVAKDLGSTPMDQNTALDAVMAGGA